MASVGNIAHEFDEFDIYGTELYPEIQSNNYIRTTRYTFYNFIPLTILSNFQRFANIYFLFIAVIGFLPSSPISPVTQILPLIFVISVSMIKELIEDLFRYHSDKIVNSVKFEVFRNGYFTKLKCSEIRPGDVIKVCNNKELPSDILILKTSEKGNTCYINEVNLNGETAIKQKKALQFFSDLRVPDDLSGLNGHIKIPMPCNDLKKLNGSLEINNDPYGFSIQNCALRGTFLVHTQWVIGLVLYTGHDTRIIQNQRHPPYKTSHLDSKLNHIILFIFLFNFVLVLFSTIMSLKYDKKLSFYYVTPLKQNFGSFIQVLSGYAMIFSYMIPISLYVTIEFVRFFQRWTFQSDLGMYAPGLGFCQPKNSNLNEELGQINHLFSDKTGTLTENKMKFVKVSARGEIYDVTSNKNDIKEKISESIPLKEIMSCIVLCHSVILTADGYSSESPDEEALVTYSAEIGAKLIDRVPDESMTVELGGIKSEFQHLATVDFDSDRKRMTTVVRAPNGQIVVYTKGADSVMFNLFSKMEDKNVIDLIQTQVDGWASQGLRTLVCGWRLMSEEEWKSFSQKLHEASLEMVNREEKMKEVGATIEKDLVVLGALAIEDELQPDVAETISYLSLMGIKLWILTGDKHETAVSIARSTNVIVPDCKVYDILTSDPNEIQSVYTEVSNCHTPSVLVVSTEGLKYLIDENPKLLVEFGELCRSVICFRMSPFLKSKVVETMQNNTNKICLAVGDGANDVNMIQTANVGVGIIGREGRQAAANSDFAITRFKHLKRLLAVHGRLSLIRLSGVIRYMIYKNIVFCFPHLWYFIFTNWSPTTLFDGWFLATYNLIWTLFPPGIYGFFEQDISILSMMKYPIVYRETRSGRDLSWWRFFMEVINAIYQSFILFYFHIILPSKKILNERGFVDGQISSGVSLFVGIVITVNLQNVIRSQHWNVFLFLGVVVSILIFFLFNLPYGSFPSLVPQMYFVPQTLFTMMQSYFILLLSVITSLFPEAIISYIKGMWKPSFTRIIRESEIVDSKM